MGEGRFALLGGAAAIHKCYQPANLPRAGLGDLTAPSIGQSVNPATGPAVIIFRPPWALIESGSLRAYETNTLPEAAAIPIGF
jgi:hypothetical protein